MRNFAGAVLEFTGAFSASAIGYIFPALIFFHVYNFELIEGELPSSSSCQEGQYPCGSSNIGRLTSTTEERQQTSCN